MTNRHESAAAHIAGQRVEFQPDSAFIDWPAQPSRKPTPLPLCIRPIGYEVDGPFKRRDWNKAGHVAVVIVALAIGVPLILHVIAKWGV